MFKYIIVFPIIFLFGLGEGLYGVWLWLKDNFINMFLELENE